MKTKTPKSEDEKWAEREAYISSIPESERIDVTMEEFEAVLSRIVNTPGSEVAKAVRAGIDKKKALIASRKAQSKKLFRL